MALQKTETTRIGLVANNAYHRVEYATVVSKTKLSFQVRSYVTPDLPYFDDRHYECAYDIGGSNPLAQAYTHIKALPEFADAVDC